MQYFKCFSSAVFKTFAVFVFFTAGAVYAAGSEDVTACPAPGKSFAPALSSSLPPAVADLPLFGEIEWETTKLPWVEAGPEAGISGAGMVVSDDKIYVAGGFIPGGDGSQDTASRRTSRWTWRYDPARKAWNQLPDLPFRREYVRAIAARNRLHVIGGACQYKGSDPPYRVHGDCAVLDLHADAPAWQEMAPLNVPRTHMAVGYVAGSLIVAGGNEYIFAQKGYSNQTIRGTVEVFELDHPEKGWQMRKLIPGVPRGWCASCTTKDALYLFSGLTWNEENDPVAVSESLRYDPAADTWEKLAPPPLGFSGWECALYVGRYALSAGGVARNEAEGAVPVVWSDISLAYDIEKDRWLRVEGVLPPGAVFNDPGVAVIGDTIYVLGAEGPGGTHFNYFLRGRIKVSPGLSKEDS